MPKRGRSIERHSEISKAEKQNLNRFGCTFREKTGVLYIDWQREDVARATNAEIFARLVFVNTNLGPIVLLACEITPIRPLPRYCYFPFDLRKQGHRDYLSRFAETGEIRLRFLSGTTTLDRVHRLTPYIRAHSLEVYAQALREWEAWEGKYDFDATLQLFERHARIPLFLERVLLDDILSEIRANAKQAAEGVPTENRDLAAHIVREAAKAFEPYYQTSGKDLFEKANQTRLGLLCMIDLRRMFAGDPGSLTELATDALAGELSSRELEGVNRLLTLILSLLKLPFREEIREQSPPSDELVIPDVSIELLAMVQSIVTSGIPKNSASRILELIGLKVGGQPGRPTKDYSREYGLKVSGSWTDVARRALAESPELQTEFGACDYDSLDRRVQERLCNRIRQGVIAYAQRVGKPLPSEADVARQTPTERQQKIP